ncbi:MAG TPA: hypothetical protein VLI93_17955, partial [Acetobacteraceae bacterium]|nr:hypothetical protein [Acetobacteraceae bacterium]
KRAGLSRGLGIPYYGGVAWVHPDQWGNAVAEWMAFETARRSDATDTMGLLLAIYDWGPDGIPLADRTASRLLYCHRSGGWRVFYTIAGPFDGPWRVTVLHVTSAPGGTPDDAAAQEAERRQSLRRVQEVRP